MLGLYVLFFVTSMLSLISGDYYISQQIIAVEGANNASFVFSFLVQVLIATVVLIILIKLNAKLFIRLFESLAVIFSTYYLLFPFFGDFALILGVLLLLKNIYPSLYLKNLAAIFSGAGIAAILGSSTTPLISISILLIFSIYDFISVFKTKHMVYMAKNVVSMKGQSFTITIPESSRSRGYIDLGVGDLALPAMFYVSTIPSLGVFSYLLPFFGMFGLYILSHPSFKNKVLPALPPISLLSLIGYIILVIF